jgi:O-antigen ligase
VIFSSIVFELIAALTGPIAPIFGNYKGDKPPTPEYYWSRGNLFEGERIQGIVGNSNLLAYVAMIGLVVFAVEYAIIAGPRWLSVFGLVGSALCIALAKSAGIGFAMVAIVAAAIVSIAAEGKNRDTRHRYYRFAWFTAGIVGFFVLVYRAQVFEFFGKSPDMTGRSGIWKLVLKLIAQKPTLGWGWISYWVPGVKPYDGLVVIKGVPYYQAHNAYLDMWLQLGLIGLALLVAVLVLTFVKLWRLAVRHTSVLYLWPILAFVGLLAQNLTESRMLIEIGWAMLALFAVKANEPSEALEPKGRSPKRARLLALGLLQSRFQQRKDR